MKETSKSPPKKRKKRTKPRGTRGNGKKEKEVVEPPIGTAEQLRKDGLTKTQKGGSKQKRQEDITQYMTEATKGLPVDYDYDVEYDPVFHPQKVIECMSEGSSWEELCLDLGVLRFVIIQWMGEYDEFKDAMLEGVHLSMAWWKRQGRKNIFNPYFNNSLYINQMANRFLENKSKVVAENLIDEGFEQVQMNEVEDVSLLSDAELEAKLKEGGTNESNKKTVKRKREN